MEYGYCRISRKTMNIERQVRNILGVAPNAKLFLEAFTGTKVEGKKEFEKLCSVVKEGDVIYFDSVSRMSRNSDEGVRIYMEMLDRGIELLVKEIRMDCACGPEMGKGNKIKGIYEKETDPYVFVKKTNKLNLGFSLEYDGEAYYLIYPQCYCSCVKRNPEQLSKTWCYCTLGYSNQRVFTTMQLHNTDTKIL